MAYDGPFPITVPDGGTGAATLTGVLIGNGTSAVTGNAVTRYDVLVGGASNAISSVGPGTSLQVLQSGGASANPAYSTATYPATTTINQILYSSSANTVAGLSTANNGILITSAGGVPSILADGTTGQVLTATTGSPPSWANSASVGGSLVLIQSQTVSSGSSLTFTTGIGSPYNNYLLVCSGLISSTSQFLELRVSTNGGSSYISSGYQSGLNYLGWNNTTLTNENSTTLIFIYYSTVGTYAGNANVSLYLPNGGGYPSTFSQYSIANTMGITMGSYLNSVTVNAFEIVTNVGTFSGTFTLFGILE